MPDPLDSAFVKSAARRAGFHACGIARAAPLDPRPLEEAADWIAASTPERSVFVTNGWLNSPTDPAGRLRVLTFTPYIANLGYPPDARAALVDRIYCDGTADEAADLARSLGATYLLDTGPPRDCVPTSFEESPDWELAYESGSLRIWRVAAGLASTGQPASLSFGR